MPVPVVGMHFRPPAKAIMQAAPAGASLRLELEPENPYDCYAIKVFITPSPEWPSEALAALEEALPNQGSSLEEALGTEFHIGYIASKAPKNYIGPTAPQIQPALQALLDQGLPLPTASLTFTPEGAPAADFQY